MRQIQNLENSGGQDQTLSISSATVTADDFTTLDKSSGVDYYEILVLDDNVIVSLTGEDPPFEFVWQAGEKDTLSKATFLACSWTRQTTDARIVVVPCKEKEGGLSCVSKQQILEAENLDTIYAKIQDIVDIKDIQFDLTNTSDPAEGELNWNSDDGTLQVGLSGGVVNLQIGSEIVVKGKATGSAIANGEVVYISGASGTNPEFSLANATTISANRTLGIATEDITQNTNGYVTTFGLVRGIDTSSFSAGDQLYLDTTSGQITNSAPSYPNSAIRIGVCIVSNSDEGVIFICIRPELDQVALTRRGDSVFVPMSGITDSAFELWGTFWEQANTLSADYATDFALGNQHLYVFVDAVTTGGDIVITGVRATEESNAPISDTETLTIDTTEDQYYQTGKKWLVITNIDISSGTVTGLDYDIGAIGYIDFGNQNTAINGYRLDVRPSSANCDLSMKIQKVVDDGGGKMSFLTIENIGFESTVSDGAIVDEVRTGDDERSYTASVQLAPPNKDFVFKTLDLQTYFTVDEYTAHSTQDEGWIVSFDGVSSGSIGGGLSNIEHSTLTVYYNLV